MRSDGSSGHKLGDFDEVAVGLHGTLLAGILTPEKGEISFN